MKTTNIVLLIILAASLALIVSMVGDFSSRETFVTAQKKQGKKFQIVANLDTLNHPLHYDPKTDPNKFTFYAKDKGGNICKVIFAGTKPQDFERSESLTMTGIMQGDEFHCSQILMKCPSKYKNDQIAISKDT